METNHNEDVSIRILKEQTLSLASNTIRIHWILGLPDTVHGVVAQQADAEYMVLINADKPKECQDEAIEHELLHIVRDDLNSNLPVTVLEEEVRNEVRNRKQKGMKPLYCELMDAE